jgi:integrase
VRTYYVYAGGRHVAVDGGEKEALSKQAELRGRVARGERVATSGAKFGVVADQWYASKRKLRDRSRANYRAALDNVLIPRFGHLRLAAITPDAVAALIRELEAKGLAGSTIQNTLKPLTGTFKFAARRGLVTQNPVAVLTPDERPSPARREHRELSSVELERLLRVASRFAYFPLIRTAVYTGLRLGELLGLTWADVDFDRAEIHVYRQWTTGGGFSEPKTPSAVRRVVLAPDLVRFLREHKARSRFSTETDFVFASKRGTPLGHRNVCRSFTEITEKAGLDGEPRFTFHSLRAVYAALMIERGITSTVLASQMGHADSGVTERKYIHLFNRVRTDEAVRAAVQEAMGANGTFVGSTDGNEREPEAGERRAQVAYLHARVPAASR